MARQPTGRYRFRTQPAPFQRSWGIRVSGQVDEGQVWRASGIDREDNGVVDDALVPAGHPTFSQPKKTLLSHPRLKISLLGFWPTWFLKKGTCNHGKWLLTRLPMVNLWVWLFRPRGRLVWNGVLRGSSRACGKLPPFSCSARPCPRNTYETGRICSVHWDPKWFPCVCFPKEMVLRSCTVRK